MASKLSFQEQLDLQIRKARRAGNRLAVLYYVQCRKCSACASWEIFSTSYAGAKWIEDHKRLIPH